MREAHFSCSACSSVSLERSQPRRNRLGLPRKHRRPSCDSNKTQCEQKLSTNDASSLPSKKSCRSSINPNRRLPDGTPNDSDCICGPLRCLRPRFPSAGWWRGRVGDARCHGGLEVKSDFSFAVSEGGSTGSAGITGDQRPFRSRRDLPSRP
jgi:hypothetical protein